MPSPHDPLTRPMTIDAGTLCRGRSPIPGPKGTALEQIDRIRQGAPFRGPLIGEAIRALEIEVDCAQRPEDLLAAARRIQDVKRFYGYGSDYRPTPGDDAVREAVRDAVLAPLEGIRKLAAGALFDVLADEEKALGNALKESIDEIVAEVAGAAFGKLGEKLAKAARSGSLEDITAAAAEVVTALTATLKDPDALTRTAIRVLKRKGVVANERQLRQILQKWGARVAEGLGSAARLLAAPLTLGLKVFFTSSSVADDKGEWYHAFPSLEARLYARMAQMLGEGGQGPRDALRSPSIRPASTGPTIRRMP